MAVKRLLGQMTGLGLRKKNMEVEPGVSVVTRKKMLKKQTKQ